VFLRDGDLSIPSDNTVQAIQLEALADESKVLLANLQDSSLASGLSTVASLSASVIAVPLSTGDNTPSSGGVANTVIWVAVTVAVCAFIILAAALMFAYRRKHMWQESKKQAQGNVRNMPSGEITTVEDSPTGTAGVPVINVRAMDINDDAISDYTESVYSAPNRSGKTNQARKTGTDERAKKQPSQLLPRPYEQQSESVSDDGGEDFDADDFVGDDFEDSLDDGSSADHWFKQQKATAVPVVKPSNRFDPMHVIFAGGVLGQEVMLLLRAAKAAHGVYFKEIRQYMDEWSVPDCGHRGKPSDCFNERRESSSHDTLKAQASQLLGMYPILRHFVLEALSNSTALETQRRSFLALCEVCDWVVKGMHCNSKEDAVEIAAELAAAVKNYLLAFQLAYAVALLRIKHHELLHLPAQLLLDGTLMSCWTLERKNASVKEAMENQARPNQIRMTAISRMVNMQASREKYKSEDVAITHDHWPSIWSFAYYINAPKGAPGLFFPEMGDQGGERNIEPGLLVFFEGHIKHAVRPAKFKGYRYVVSGNIKENNV